MRIAVDARVLGGRFTGDRTYWSNLLGALARTDTENEYRLYVRTPLTESGDAPSAPNFSVVTVPAGSERLWSLAAFPAAVRADKCDVAHVQYTVPPRMPCPTVTTIHDITFRLFPKLFTLRDRVLLNLSLPGSVRRSAHVITVSENTKRDLLAAFAWLDPAKVTATLLAADPRYTASGDAEADRVVLAKYGIDGPYVLSVGVLQPRKNLPMLLRAFAAACERGSLPHRLVVTGKRGWLADDVSAAIAGAGERVRFTDYVPDSDLPALYRGADLHCYPSLYEGFGLPPLEAMACGCPVLASNTSSLPEVVGDAGVLLPPNRQDMWEAEIGALLTDPTRREAMAAAGIARAATFSWERTARQTLAVYGEAHENR